MEKRISYSQFQQVKSAAKMIDPLQRKMVPLKAKIAALVGELKGYQTQIDALEAGIVSILGFHVADLVKKVIEPTGKTDPKTGKPLTVTKYLPTDMVSYDEQKKQYVISVPEMPTGALPGSDYDADAGSLHTNEEVSEHEIPVSEASPSDSNLPWN
jgi:hypothetical protein